jgi:hypothetical protein
MISTFPSSVNSRRSAFGRGWSRTGFAGGSTLRRTARGWGVPGAGAGRRAVGPGPPLGAPRSRPRTPRPTAGIPAGVLGKRRLGNVPHALSWSRGQIHRQADRMRWASCLIAVALGAALVAGPTLGAAQQPGKMSRIGILSPAARPRHQDIRRLSQRFGRPRRYRRPEHHNRVSARCRGF